MSASGAEDFRDAAKAAQLGALDFICGFGANLGEEAALSLRRRLMTLIGLCRARRKLPPGAANSGRNTPPCRRAPKGQSPIAQHAPIARTTPEALKRSPKPSPSNHRIELIAIGVSTGGPTPLPTLSRFCPKTLESRF